MAKTHHRATAFEALFPLRCRADPADGVPLRDAGDAAVLSAEGLGHGARGATVLGPETGRVRCGLRHFGGCFRGRERSKSMDVRAKW